MRINPILRTDSYKQSHFVQYPEGAAKVVSYIEARGYSDWEAPVVFFGLQAFIKEYLTDPVTQADVDEAESVVTAHGLPFNREGWQYIVDKHDGFLPIYIEALPEGTVTKPGVPLVQIWNTDVKVPWLTSFVETQILRAVWYPTTVASLSRSIKSVIKRYMELTSDNVDGLPFKLHDFGARGASSSESAMLGGMGHLVNFQGTDTMEAIVGARKYYNADMAGFSIPASEHSTITSWGRDNEDLAYANMVNQFADKGKLFACVSDSYDLYNAVENIWGEELRGLVEESGATLVVRPDSGDPVEVTLRVVELLDKKFGSTYNSKGYKVLNPAVRIIQGDGVNKKSIEAILSNFRQNGWSADNIAFGMGGALLQKVDRDTLKFAMKANTIVFADGSTRDVYKDPITDSGKRSKRGIQLVLKDHDRDGELEAMSLKYADANDMAANELKPVFINGKIVQNQTLDQIRERAAL